MKAFKTLYGGAVKLQQTIMSDLSIGESFYNTSNVLGHIIGFSKTDENHDCPNTGIAKVHWQNSNHEGSCWDSDKCWKIIK